VEDTTSEVENYLIHSPLVTSGGLVVVAADDCTLSLLPDPATLAPGTPWKARTGTGLQSWTWRAPQKTGPGTTTAGECVMGGYALDDNSGLFFIDYRNQQLYKLLFTLQSGFGPNPVAWTADFTNISTYLAFDLDVSMLFIPGANAGDSGTLWVPLSQTLQGNSGVAATVNPLDGTFTFVALPDADCRPEDYGSAATTGQDIVLLGEYDCGVLHLDGSSSPPNLLWKTYPLFGSLSFDLGVHSHPIFDAGTNNLYFLDWARSGFTRQQLYCVSLVSYAECAGWPAQSTRVPELSVDTTDPQGDFYFRWQWMAGALQGNFLYVAASGNAKEEPILKAGLAGLTSVLYVWDVTKGALVASHRFTGDLFNSAPLVVQGTSGAPTVFVLSALGTLYAYPGGAAVAGGPSWVQPGAVNGIPADDLPSSTYAYMSLTPSGTILAVASAGGALWQTEKVYYGIVNGVFPPNGPAPASGPSPAAAAGIAIGVLGAGAAAFAGAYMYVPAFAAAVKAAAAAAQGAASTAVASAGAPAAGAGEKLGLLSKAGYGAV